MALTRQEQINLIKEQIRFLNSTEVEIAARKHKLQISLNRLLDEHTKEKNAEAIKRLAKHQK